MTEPTASIPANVPKESRERSAEPAIERPKRAATAPRAPSALPRSVAVDVVAAEAASAGAAAAGEAAAEAAVDATGDLGDTIAAGMRRIYARLSDAQSLASMPDDVRDELGNLLSAVPDLPSLGDPYVVYAAEVAVSSLVGPDPNVRISRKIREDLQRRVIEHTQTPAIWMTIGLLGVVYAIPFAWVLLGGIFAADIPNPTIIGIPADDFLGVAAAGAAGGTVSLLVRLNKFTRGKVRGEKMVFVVTGFVRPFIGASFALFVFAAIKGEMLPIDVQADVADYFFLALGFVAGFSERFVPDVLAKSGDRYLGTGAPLPDADGGGPARELRPGQSR